MNLLSCESLGHVSISVLPWSTTPLHLSLVFYLFSVLHVGCILLVGWRARGLYFTPALRWHLLRTKGRSAMLCMDPGNCKEWKDAPGDSREFSADGRRTKPGGLFTTRSAQVKATVIWGRSARRARKGKSCKVVYFKMGAPMTWPPHLSHWFLLIEAFGSPWSSTSVIAPWITGRPDAHIVLTLSGQPFHFFLLQKWKWIWLKLSFQIQKLRFSFCFFVVSGFSLLQFAKAFCSHAFIEETDAS